MKAGQVPIHIMRFAPTDYVNDSFVRRCYQKRDYRTAAFYPVFLFWCHMEGGDVPADPEEVSSRVLMPVRDVVHAIDVCKAAGKIQEEDGRLFHRRVKRDVEKELEFRRNQAELGKKGAQARINKVAQGKPEGSLSPRGLNPPSPAPAPAPTPAPSSSSSGEDTPPDEPTNSGAPPEEEESGGIRCPRCETTGSLMRERNDRPSPGWFCRRKRNGCGASIDLGHEEVLRQLSPHVRRSVMAELRERHGIARNVDAPDPPNDVQAWFEAHPRPVNDLAQDLAAHIEAREEVLTRQEAIDEWRQQLGAPLVVFATVKQALSRLGPRREQDRSPPPAAPKKPTESV